MSDCFTIQQHVYNLKTCKLWIYLNAIHPDYAQRTVTFITEITAILDTVVEYFPYYTRHDAIHGYQVLRRMEQIVKPECMQQGNEISFSAAEIFLLICAAYAHDLGMTILPGDEEEILGKLKIEKNGEWQTDIKLQNYLRETHSERGGKYIIDNHSKLKIPLSFTAFLDLIMKSHNMDINELELNLKRIALDGKPAELKQLACILCIADVLEFSDTRVIDGVIEQTQNATTPELIRSYRENMKHESIGYNLAITNEEILVAGSFNDPLVLNLAHKTIDEVQSWCNAYKEIDERLQNPVLSINPYNIKREFLSHGFEFERIGIKLRKDNIIRLISSDSMWGKDPKIAIKELLQNSVEACRYRQNRTPSCQVYLPEILLKYCSKSSKLTISDNGCGMSRNVITNNFLTVGNSRSFEKTYSSGHDPLARFGIGFWSVFTIANETEIETAPFESIRDSSNPDELTEGIKFSVSIDELKDFTVLEPVSKSAGTEITLNIKEEFSRQLHELYFWAKEILICSSIPITIYIDQNKYEIPQTIVPITLDMDKRELDPVNKFKKAVINNNLKLFQWGSKETRNQDLKISMAIVYDEDTNGQPTFMSKDGNFSFHNSIEFLDYYGICGFKMPGPWVDLQWSDSLPGRYYKSIIFNINNPKGLKFDIHRTHVLPSSERAAYNKRLQELMITGFKEFLNFTNSNNPKTIFHINRQSLMPSSDVFRDYTTPEGYELYKDLICYRVYEVKEYGGEISYNESYFRMEDLLQLKGTIWFYQTSLFAGSHPFISLVYPNSYFKGVKGPHERISDPLIPHIFKAVIEYILSVNPNEPNYLIESNRDAAILYYNDPEAEIHTIGDRELPFLTVEDQKPCILKDGYIQLFKINHKNFKIDGQKSTSLFSYGNKNIVENKIISPANKTQFLFLNNRDEMVVDKNSQLATDINEMKSKADFAKISELVQLLESAYDGIIDESVKKYIG